MPSSEPYDREAVVVRASWRGRERLPFDEIASWDGATATLQTGDRRAVVPADRPGVSQALTPPTATGQAQTDVAQLAEWMAGPWSPRRAAAALLQLATCAQATDLHLESGPAGHAVRLRLAGQLVDCGALPTADGRRLVAALKHAAGCLPYRTDLVQEGRIQRDGVAADVRASFLPTATGERVALRLFGRLRDLDALGLDPDTQSGFQELLDLPSGLVLVAGPSGGGKTTTVYAALTRLAARRPGAHLSIEDPVEQRLRVAGVPVDQVELRPDRGVTAEAALRGALRQDIDVVALSEIRTPGEAALALRAAHTGRLVVAGLHAGNAPEARQRMLDLGADPKVLATTLRGVLHQRLEPAQCGPHPQPQAVCPECGGTGTRRQPTGTLWRPM